MSTYLTRDDVLGIHQDSVEAFGGGHGVLDRNGLEAAVMRPQSGALPVAAHNTDLKGMVILPETFEHLRHLLPHVS